MHVLIDFFDVFLKKISIEIFLLIISLANNVCCMLLSSKIDILMFMIYFLNVMWPFTFNTQRIWLRVDNKFIDDISFIDPCNFLNILTLKWIATIGFFLPWPVHRWIVTPAIPFSLPTISLLSSPQIVFQTLSCEVRASSNTLLISETFLQSFIFLVFGSEN